MSGDILKLINARKQSELRVYCTSSISLSQPHSKPVSDPENNLPLEIIQKIANGEIEPEDASEVHEKKDLSIPKEDAAVTEPIAA